MHLYECVAPDVDINLHRVGDSEPRRYAAFRERFIDSRSCWVVFIHVLWECPSGLLQFSKGETVKISLASDSSGIHAMWPNRETPCLNSSWKMWLLSFLSHIITSHMVVPFDSNSLLRHHWSRAHVCIHSYIHICIHSGGSRKKYLGAWPLIIWEATTSKRNYYRTN